MKGPKTRPVRESDLLRAIRALGELDAYQYHRFEELYRRDSVIGYLNLRVAELEAGIIELEAKLEAANARIRELEDATSTPTINETHGHACPQEVTQ